MNKTSKMTASFLTSMALVTILIGSYSTTKTQKENGTQGEFKMEVIISSPAFSVIQPTKGYMIEMVADKHSYTTAVAWNLKSNKELMKTSVDGC
jgi:hypothetical protein